MKRETAASLSREQQAHEEVGVTDISRRAAAWFVAVWLVLVGGVFVTDHAVELASGRGVAGLRSLSVPRAVPGVARDAFAEGVSLRSLLAFNRGLLKVIGETETAIEEESAVAMTLRPAAQAALWALGVGNEQVLRGRNGWMFYRPGVDAVTGPGFLDPQWQARRRAAADEWQTPPEPDPRPALIAFREDLAARGIDLLVAPIPVKPELLPDRLSARASAGEVVHNVSMPAFLDACRDAGIEVLDVAAWMAAYQRDSGLPAYLQTDTHWTPEAMEFVAASLASEIAGRLGWVLPAPAPADPATVTNRGDVAAMLDLPDAWHPYPAETATVSQVTSPGGGFWRSDPAAEVLLLGDSFANIYSLEAMGWGESAGLAEHLSRSLGRPIDRLVRNDAGAHATRRLLARELARGRDRLAGKKVVVFTFASRELSLGDWPVTPLQLGTAPPASFLSLPPGETLAVSGVVAAVSAAPRPGTVPYRDHVVSVHLVDLEAADRTDLPREAVVFLQSMTDNEWTPAARLRPGDNITLRLRSWTDMAETMDGLNRSELDDLDLQLQEPVWGEL